MHNDLMDTFYVSYGTLSKEEQDKMLINVLIFVYTKINTLEEKIEKLEQKKEKKSDNSWTDEEIEALRLYFPTKGVYWKEWSKYLSSEHCDINAICAEVGRLHIKKVKE